MPRISQLPSLPIADNSDEIAIVDTSASVTKKITRGDLLKAPLPSNSVTTPAIADTAITSDKIDFTTFPIERALVTAIAVGTSDTVLKTFNITKAGNYALSVRLVRGNNVNAGALVTAAVKQGATVVASQTLPTVPNYAGNQDVVNSLTTFFNANAGDVITIVSRKDRVEFSSNIGCYYDFARIA